MKPENTATNRDVMSVFSQNLRVLTKNEPSISELCRKLSINRSQFNRYLSGQASPRPLLLQRICDYFNVDARILLEPFSPNNHHAADTVPTGLDQLLPTVYEPAHHSIFPDGLYSEWKYSMIYPGCISFSLLRVYTQDGIRRVRSKHPLWLIPGKSQMVKNQVFGDITGIAINQSNAIAIMDCSNLNELISFGSFQISHSLNPNLYPGIEVSGSSHLQISGYPVFLEKLPNTTKDILSAARTPRIMAYSAAPEYVQNLLQKIEVSGFISHQNPAWGTNTSPVRPVDKTR